MIHDRQHDLPITKQAEILPRISRRQRLLLAAAGAGSRPLRSCGGSTDCTWSSPFAGSRMLRRLAGRRGEQDRPPSCEDASKLRRMGIEALYRRPRTTKPELRAPRSIRILLRGVEITQPNQGCGRWTSPISRWSGAGFVYLAVVLDWFSRRVLSWSVSITMEAAFCVETLESALARHGKPEILNTDQGSQFTGAAFTGVLIENGIAISMDGKGAWRDNVFVERLWRSVKYEGRFISELLHDPAHPRRAHRSGATSTSTIVAGRIRALTALLPITPTSPRCPSAWQLNPADAPLIEAEKLFRQPGLPQSASSGMCGLRQGCPYQNQRCRRVDGAGREATSGLRQQAPSLL